MPRYLELEISLSWIEPRIWRRILIRAEASFAALHEAIQDSFGWQYCHLWEFRRDGAEQAPIAGLPSPSGELVGCGPPVPDAERTELSHYFGRKPRPSRCFYVYDFGDSWEHEVKLVGTVDEPEAFERRLISGKRACPPEDCGGVDGYERMVQFIETGEDPWGDDAEELAEWVGDWRPEGFDVEQVRRRFDR